jgi:hypothetical protein
VLLVGLMIPSDPSVQLMVGTDIVHSDRATAGSHDTTTTWLPTLLPTSWLLPSYYFLVGLLAVGLPVVLAVE